MGISKFVVVLSALTSCAGLATAGIADFYITDASGVIFTVDGQTLVATERFEVETSDLGMNDIIFVGDNKMLANVTGQLVQYDMDTGEEVVVFDVRDVYPDGGFYLTGGLARTQDDKIFFSTWGITPKSNSTFGALYDPITQTYEELADFEESLGYQIGHHHVGGDLFLTADWAGEKIRVINTMTGEFESVFDVGFGPVSFLETNGQLYTMTRDGFLYTFDFTTGESEYYGQISGAGGSIIGMASSVAFRIPAPSSLAIFGFASLAVARRRR